MARSQEEHPEVQCVGPLEADRLFRAGATPLDVRDAYEWRAGHIPGALHVPIRDLKSRLDALTYSEPLVVICRSGFRSAHTAAILARSGIDAVNLEGGMQAWAATHLAVEADDGLPGMVA